MVFTVESLPRKYFHIISLTVIILSAPLPFVLATSGSPYDSGYDHGCDDAEISDPSERYINQPEKGPAYHTEEFMNGYDNGFNSCSSDSSLPECDGSYQDCVTERGDVCEAGSTAHECELDESSDSGSPEYDCSEGSDGCNGLIYCDIDDTGDRPCYDRFD